jgi:hypothetical protein
MENFTNLAKERIPGITVTPDSVYINSKLVFSSTDGQAIQTFLFGLIVGSALKK